MTSAPDPFTGIWIFDTVRSNLSTPAPRSWTQTIEIHGDDIQVREEIARHDGSQTIVAVRARFDGADYPVTGSPAADAIAYRRIGTHQIAGAGKKGGIVSLRETVEIAGGRLRLTYSLYSAGREVASGVAVFVKKNE
ncbi:MAG TPA: hypothetical protein VJN43_15275 [Bryobacteraceae bacterium]|nr:hypothetical protein [Bryobacteraceae bacterium]